MLRWSSVIHIVSRLNLGLGLSMLIPLMMALLLQEADAPAFGIAMLITVLLNGAVSLWFRKGVPDIGHREGFAIVTLGWFSACIFAALPFLFYGHMGEVPEMRYFTNAFFESASGLTTTGATILAHISALPHASHWWRSIIQWYGGMGIIVFSLVLLPRLGVGGMQLFKAEVPGPTADKSTPRLQDTARMLWRVYILISAAQVVALIVAGMDVFNAFCHTFTTMATGGFSPQDAGIMAFAGKPAIIIVLTFFMFVAGANFSLHMGFLLNRRFRIHLRDGEFRVYVLLIGVFSLAVTLLLLFHNVYASIPEAVMHALFNVISLVTTTGYHSADFEAWGMMVPAIGVILFVTMFLGGMSGSTGGAIKTVRLWLLSKLARRELHRLVHPRGVFTIKSGNRKVSETVIQGIAGFFILYIAIFFVGTMAVSIGGSDFITSATAVASCLGNVGPGLGAIGPTDNYLNLAGWVKWLLAFLMVIGRLELYTVLVLLSPAFWKK